MPFLPVSVSSTYRPPSMLFTITITNSYSLLADNQRRIHSFNGVTVVSATALVGDSHVHISTQGEDLVQGLCNDGGGHYRMGLPPVVKPASVEFRVHLYQ